MVNYGLQFKATLSPEIKVLSCKKPDFVWLLKLECTNCKMPLHTWQHVSQDNVIPIAGGHGTTNYLAKCKMCRLELKMSVVPESITDYLLLDSEQLKTICVFDCRGVKPVDFMFGDDWMVRAISGLRYDSVDLTEDEGFWVHYEESTQNVLEISQASFKFIKVDK